jgi:hypothetical protein
MLIGSFVGTTLFLAGGDSPPDDPKLLGLVGALLWSMSLLVLAYNFRGRGEPGWPFPNRLGRIRRFAGLTFRWLEAALVTALLVMATLFVVRAIGIASRAAA